MRWWVNIHNTHINCPYKVKQNNNDNDDNNNCTHAIILPQTIRHILLLITYFHIICIGACCVCAQTVTYALAPIFDTQNNSNMYISERNTRSHTNTHTHARTHAYTSSVVLIKIVHRPAHNVILLRMYLVFVRVRFACVCYIKIVELYRTHVSRGAHGAHLTVLYSEYIK